MKLSEAKIKLEQACSLIFEVEEQFKDDKHPIRREGYKARIAVGNFENQLRAEFGRGWPNDKEIL